MRALTTMTEQQAWQSIDRLRAAHGLASTSTPAGILLEHPDAGAISLTLWDSRQDLVRLVQWLADAGIATEL